MNDKLKEYIQAWLRILRQVVYLQFFMRPAMLPFQGFKVFFSVTQGDALGYCISPLWGFDVLPQCHYVAL
ncbi:MAG: hypothetical protein JXD22_09575 [Sedimentisphaerales bacterium]|nr:hypothetical protein [Sedimentisphaerales bacterium]